MKTTVNVFGVLLSLVGLVWFLQGIGVLPGSFMSGQTRWAIYGALACVTGVALLVTMGVRSVILNTVAGVLLFLGTVWFLQGISVLPGSAMTGQTRWAVNGAIADLVGVVILVVNRRKARAHVQPG